MANEIFISYSRKDVAKVIEIKNYLDKELGIECWMDLDGIESGDQFKDVIISAINRHQVVLFIMTENSMNSTWALKELNFAEKKKKRIILVDLDHSPMTDAFEFDYGSKDNINWSISIQRDKLIKNLRLWLNKSRPSSTIIDNIVINKSGNTKTPSIPDYNLNYMEAITKTVMLREVYKDQIDGCGKYADIIVSVGPVDKYWNIKENGRLQFVNDVRGSNIPREFIPPIKKGFETAMRKGVLRGYPVESLKVVVLDGSFHPIESDQSSFEKAAQIAFKEACVQANPVLLEPIMKFEIKTVSEDLGDVLEDLNKRSGMIVGMGKPSNGYVIIKAIVPLFKMEDYETTLRTITSMEYDRHTPVQ